MRPLRAHPWFPLAFLTVATLLLLLPFLNKPFHIDDPLFVWTAKNITQKPLAAYDFDVNWYVHRRPMPEVMQNPPLFAYYLAPFGAAFSFSEPVLHSAVFLVAMISVAGIYLLAKRFCDRPFLAALLCILSPTFLVSSTQVMCDTMLVALWVWALWLWIRGIDQQRFALLLVASLLAGTAALTKYFGAALLPLMALYAVLTPPRLWRTILPLLLPVAMIAGYEWLTKVQYGAGLFSGAAAYTTEKSLIDASKVLASVISGTVFVGGCLFPIWLLAIMYRPKLGLWLLFGVFVLSQALLILNGFVPTLGVRDARGIRWPLLLTSSVLMSGGLYILSLPMIDLWRRRDLDSLVLACSLFGTFLFVTCVNWTVNARVLLPLLPAAAILFIRVELPTPGSTRLALWSLGGGLVASAILTLSIADADHRFAECDREAARKLLAEYRDHEAPLYFSGHWGFQYYMEEGGAQAVDARKDRFEPNQILICAFSNVNFFFLPDSVARLVERREFPVNAWIATMSTPKSAGFYSTIFGKLPFQFGAVAPHQFLIQETTTDFDLPTLVAETTAALKRGELSRPGSENNPGLSLPYE